MHAPAWPRALLVGGAAASSMISYWFMICSVLPSIRLREGAAVNLGSTAGANSLPAGGALAMGVSWTMLSGCGVIPADYVLYSVVSGIWNVFSILGLPVVALLIMATAARPDAVLIAAPAAGLALLAAAVAGFCLLMRRESFAPRPGGVLQLAAAAPSRPPPPHPPPPLPHP